MTDWRDYIIPVALGVCLGAAGLVWLVYTVLETGMDVRDRLRRWWQGQMIEAERRRAAPRVRAPLVSIVMAPPPARPVYSVELDDEDEVAAPGTPYRDAPDTNQVEPAGSGAARTGTVLTDDALVRHLAGLQKPSGAWWLSANKIAAAAGGERESVLAIVREVRGAEPVNPANALRVRDAHGERLIAR